MKLLRRLNGVLDARLVACSLSNMSLDRGRAGNGALGEAAVYDPINTNVNDG